MTEREIVDLVRGASGRRVVAVGGGNSARPAADDVVVPTGGHLGVVALSASDLMVTVRSGTPLADLDAALREAGRRLPLAPWSPPGATIGGAVAASADGLAAANGFRWKDVVLEGRYVALDGSVVRSGARVLKSVAGFDLHRAVCGMGSRLGVVLDVTVRIETPPERCAAWTARAADAAGALRLAAVAESLPMQPRGLVVTGDGDAFVVHARIEGPGAAVEACGARLRSAGYAAGEERGAPWTSGSAGLGRIRLSRNAFPTRLGPDELADLPRRTLWTRNPPAAASNAERAAILANLGVARRGAGGAP